MYERYSIHYHSVFFPLTKINDSSGSGNSISRQIQENQKLIHLYISYYNNRFYTAPAATAIRDIKETRHDNYYYYHTRNNNTNQEEAQVFITYEELKDEIDKDLAAYKKNISVAFEEVKDASSEETVTPGHSDYPARTYPNAGGFETFMDRIEAGDVGVRLTENIGDTTRVVRDNNVNRQVGTLRGDERRFNETIAQVNDVNINTNQRNYRAVVDDAGIIRLENPFNDVDNN